MKNGSTNITNIPTRKKSALIRKKSELRRPHAKAVKKIKILSGLFSVVLFITFENMCNCSAIIKSSRKVVNDGQSKKIVVGFFKCGIFYYAN